MSQRLVYVVGPSGAGKDSVLSGLRRVWCGPPAAYWAMRSETRAGCNADDAHEWLSEDAFDALEASGAFAMAWQANGLRYGVRRSELSPLAEGACVLVNGSRAYVPELLRRWPRATVVHITAPSEVLRSRLLARQREDPLAIERRLMRSVAIDGLQDVVEIVNDGALESAVAQFHQALCQRLKAAEGPAHRPRDCA